MATYWGKVIHGKNRGKELGIPTANLKLHRKASEGIFITRTAIAGKLFKSVSFIGAAKTFREKDLYLETYIFDFNGDLYGKWISVHLLKKIRDNRAFESVKQLIRQIEADKKAALNYFDRVTRKG